MERSRSGLVGRHTELAALIGAVTGPMRLVLVEGEPGVGKSRLVRELLAQPCLAGQTMLRAHCPPVTPPFAGGAAVEALRHTADRLRAAGPLPAVTGALRSLLPELADVLPPAVDPGRHQVVRAFREILAALAPALLVIDDAQWLDPETLDLIRGPRRGGRADRGARVAPPRVPRAGLPAADRAVRRGGADRAGPARRRGLR